MVWRWKWIRAELERACQQKGFAFAAEHLEELRDKAAGFERASGSAAVAAVRVYLRFHQENVQGREVIRVVCVCS